MARERPMYVQTIIEFARRGAPHAPNPPGWKEVADYIEALEAERQPRHHLICVTCGEIIYDELYITNRAGTCCHLAHYPGVVGLDKD